MKVFFMQHGSAQSEHIDVRRALSQPGEEQVRCVAHLLKNRHIKIDSILHSGALRAEHSANLIAETLSVPRVMAIPGMKPKDDPASFIQHIHDNNALYVGHLPHLQRVVAKVICGDANRPVISFTNAAIACIDITQDYGRLEWFITPAFCAHSN